ncbi:MAG: hypothetical protein QXD40_00100 [Desulfurococcaceae archaeon]
MVKLLTTLFDSSINRSTTRGIIIEIPLKPRKRMISLRIDEDALMAVDKFVALTGEYSRTLLITKVIEALAEGLRRTGYNATSLELKFTAKNPVSGEDTIISIVLPLKKK